MITDPTSATRLTNGVNTFPLRDAQGSVRAITNAAGAKIESAIYKPFGEQSEWQSAAQTAPETKGWIGERFDADAGLQYLNARYYDPLLGVFLQPDWWDITLSGFGTNRFSYSFNDPVNGSDLGGNSSNSGSSGNNGLGPNDPPGPPGTSFSGGDRPGEGKPRALSGLDRFVAGLLGWDIDALAAWNAHPTVKGSYRNFGSFQSEYVSASITLASAGTEAGLTLIAGSPAGLLAHVHSIDRQTTYIQLSPGLIDHILDQHGLNAPPGKSQIFSQFSNPQAL